jgi:hypothetical protein
VPQITGKSQLRWMIPIWAALGIAALIAAGTGWWSLALVSTAALVLSLAPVVLAARYRVVLPLPFVASITAFIVAALVLGEALDAYERFWWWDIALHLTSAMALGMIGFLFVYMLFQGDRFASPPGALAVIAFAVATSTGVLWEILEYLIDLTFGMRMQKSGLDDTMGDLIVDLIGAVFGALAGYAYLRGSRTGLAGRLLHDFIEMNRHLYAKAGRRK